MACSRPSPAIASPALLQPLLEPASLPACKYIPFAIIASSEDTLAQADFQRCMCCLPEGEVAVQIVAQILLAALS